MQELSIDPRAYKFIRAQAMKCIADGLVELITNCIDAYRKSTHEIYYVDVETQWETKSLIKKIGVRDYSLGMNSERMKQCFLQVGAFTNEVGSRGFFSRGAKDICALGNVTFHSLKDGLYSQVKLSNEAKGEVTVQDVVVNAAHLDMLKVTDIVNCTYVEIDIDVQYQNIQQTKFLSDLVTHFALREIFSNPKNVINYKSQVNTSEPHHQQLKWTAPESNVIAETTYKVPGYDCNATLKIFKTDKVMLREFKQCGFLVRSSESIFCHTWLNMDIWADPMIEYVYGYIECDYIKDLMYTFDETGATPENPFLILDHSRGGLLDSHPFAKALYEYPVAKVSQILHDLDESGNVKRLKIDDLSELLDQFDAFKKDVEVEEPKSWRESRANEISAKIDDMKEHILEEKIVEPEMITTRKKVSSFKLQFKQFDGRVNKRYELRDTTSAIELTINLNNEVIFEHFKDTEDISDIKKSTTLYILAEILIDAFAKLLTDREVASNENLNGLEPKEFMKYLDTLNQNYKVQLDVPVYKMINKYKETIEKSRASNIEAIEKMLSKIK